MAEFERLEIRAGRVLRVERFPKAKVPAYKLWIDFGPLGVKASSARITERYAPEALVGRLVVAVTNFGPKRIADFVSEVLVLGIATDAGVVLLGLDAEVAPGSRVS